MTRTAFITTARAAATCPPIRVKRFGVCRVPAGADPLTAITRLGTRIIACQPSPVKLRMTLWMTLAN